MYKKILKRLLGMVLACSMALGNLPIVNANTISTTDEVQSGSVVTSTITGGEIISTDGIYAIDSTATGTITIAAENVTLLGNGSDTVYNNLNIVCANAGTNLTIKNVYITDTNDINTINFTGAGNNLYLAGTNKIMHSTTTGTKAMIHVGPSDELTVSDAVQDESTGELYYYNSAHGAGIGSNQYETNGKITITSGTIYGLGQKWGALIGSGNNATDTTPGDISIQGGNIYLISNATGTTGIGGSINNTGGTNPAKIYISGGSITINRNNATPPPIGGGAYTSGELVITGGSIKTYVDKFIGTPGVNDASIVLNKVNASGEAVSLLKLDTSGISDSISELLVDGQTYAVGGLHTSEFVNQDVASSPITSTQFPTNWTAGSDKNLYLYVTKKNHYIRVNGVTYRYQWDAETGTFIQQSETVSTDVTGKGTISVSNSKAVSGDTVAITANPEDGYYLAQVRLAETEGETTTYSAVKAQEDGSYSFTMPSGTVKVYADFISQKWDGTIDLTWYDPSANTYVLKYPAQLAGAAALNNGLFNHYPMTADTNGNLVPDIDANGHPDGYSESLYNEYKANSSNTAFTVVVGDSAHLKASTSTDSELFVTTHSYWYGSEDFTGKTIQLAADLDMGGTHTGSKTDGANWSGPNYMPIGGQYIMDPSNGYTRIRAGFNGTFDGQGHIVSNIYCSRKTPKNGDSMGIGLIGSIGVLITDRPDLLDNPVVKNAAVDGYLEGCKNVGGIVGETGNSKTSTIKNCMNFAAVSNVISAAGGIVGQSGTSKYAGTQTIENCANFGLVNLLSNYAGGIFGDGTAHVNNSYNLGYVKGTTENAGQALGGVNGVLSAFTNCYWLTGSSYSTTFPAVGPSMPDVNTITEISLPDTYKTTDFLTKLNANTRDWVISSSDNLTSDSVKSALQNVSALTSSLNAYDALGVAVPREFTDEASSVVLESITTEGEPTTSYVGGQKFNTGTLKLWGNYSDGTKEEITNYDITYQSGNSAITYGDTKVTVSVTYLGYSFSKDFTIQVAQNDVSSISVTTPPTNVLYAAGESFDAAGMVVNATYTNGITEPITDYTYSPTGTLSSKDDKITIQYTYQGDTVTTTQEIIVLDSQTPIILTDSEGKKTVQIQSADDMRWFANQVSSGLDTSLNAILLNNIDLTGSNWIPAGAPYNQHLTNYYINYYKGTFDGNGKTITVQYTPSSSSHPKGILFSGIKIGASIKNVTLAGTASNVSNSGIVGLADGGEILNCVNKAAIVSGGGYSGGILGYGSNGVRIKNCINQGSISTTDETANVAGIVGGLSDQESYVENCRNYGAIAGGFYVAGIVGIIFPNDISFVKDCANLGNITTTFPCTYASGVCAGGIIGYTYGGGQFDANYNAGVITSAGGSTGGIIGYVKSPTAQITNSYNTGSVLMTNEKLSSEVCAGGVIGQLNDRNITVQNCYNTGKVNIENGSTYAGAIFGFAAEGTLSNVMDNFAVSDSAKILMANNTTFIDKNARFQSSTELKGLKSVLGTAYIADGGNGNNGYPVLTWQTEDAATVIFMIDSLGEIKADSSASVTAVRGAYNNLSTGSKALVTNYATLTKAEAVYAAMSSNAKAVDGKIASIGTVTTASGNAIKAARTAYNSLTAEEKKMVTKLNELIAAESKYSKIYVSYKVTFDANGGTKLSIARVTLLNGSKIGTLPTAQKKGYMLDGWYTAKTGGSKISSSSTCVKNITYYAHWKKVNIGKIDITKLIGGSEKFAVKYKAINRANGYEIRYSLKSNMSFAKVVSTKETGKKVTGLKAAKKYYVQVRAYQLDSTGSKVYGSWSSMKSVSVIKISVGKAAITSLTAGSKEFTVNYKKVSKSNGYEIRYSLKSNMSSAKVVTITSGKKKISNLKAGGKYYVQVRAYQVDSTGSKVYGEWSSQKTVKVK